VDLAEASPAFSTGVTHFGDLGARNNTANVFTCAMSGIYTFVEITLIIKALARSTMASKVIWSIHCDIASTHVRELTNPILILTLLSLSLTDLGRETSLDSRYTSSRATRIASNEVQSILSFVELCIRRSACLACHVLHF
jgi:hypothetical protein